MVYLVWLIGDVMHDTTPASGDAIDATLRAWGKTFWGVFPVFEMICMLFASRAAARRCATFFNIRRFEETFIWTDLESRSLRNWHIRSASWVYCFLLCLRLRRSLSLVGSMTSHFLTLVRWLETVISKRNFSRNCWSLWELLEVHSYTFETLPALSRFFSRALAWVDC